MTQAQLFQVWNTLLYHTVYSISCSPGTDRKVSRYSFPTCRYWAVSTAAVCFLWHSDILPTNLFIFFLGLSSRDPILTSTADASLHLRAKLPFFPRGLRSSNPSWHSSPWKRSRCSLSRGAGASVLEPKIQLAHHKAGKYWGEKTVYRLSYQPVASGKCSIVRAGIVLFHLSAWLLEYSCF